MFEAQVLGGHDKVEDYAELARQAGGLFASERDAIANAANLASLLFWSLPDLNWAGFYLLRDGELVLGPFQGKPACIRIALGRGVCGAAAASQHSVVVEDVEAFPGHIPCDAASRSELVVPLVSAGQLVGVIDLDSPSLARFDAEDQAGIERLAALWLAASDWAALS
ncbi:GAF domain-containing protein [Sphingosinicellaceae bacterium]|nr:GAF domain-containing protein [Sphingosinicellaceae bacterium]